MPVIGVVRQSLGIATTAMALLAASAQAVLAQSPEAQTLALPASPQPSAKDEKEVWLATGAKPKSVVDSWLSGFEMKCTGCQVETTALFPETTDANALWLMRGKWQRQTSFGAVSAGFVGLRNYASPLYTALPLGGDIDLRMLEATRSSVFAPTSQWSLTASVEKTFFKSKGGATIGVVADAMMPVATSSAIVGDARMSGMTPTVRAGFVFRW
jgi:hypothetical protein